MSATIGPSVAMRTCRTCRIRRGAAIEVGPALQASELGGEGKPAAGIELDELERTVAGSAPGATGKARPVEREVDDEELADAAHLELTVDLDRHGDRLEPSEAASAAATPAAVSAEFTPRYRARACAWNPTLTPSSAVMDPPAEARTEIPSTPRGCPCTARLAAASRSSGDPERAGDVVRPPEWQQRYLGLVPVDVRDRMERSVAAQQDDAALFLRDEVMDLVRRNASASTRRERPRIEAGTRPARSPRGGR